MSHKEAQMRAPFITLNLIGVNWFQYGFGIMLASSKLEREHNRLFVQIELFAGVHSLFKYAFLLSPHAEALLE